ncbi:MAG: XdhC family protein [Bacteroidia bacterium]
MVELISQMEAWVKEGKPFALATVIKTWGSSPRPIGSPMIISQNLEMAGSVSGGCVEGDVVKASVSILENGGGKTLTYGVTDEDAWTVGLSCGGKIDVYLEKFLAFSKEEKMIWERLLGCLKGNLPCIFITQIKDGENAHVLVEPSGNTLGKVASPALIEEAQRAYRERKHQIIELEGETYFLQVFPHKSRMMIIGAAHITVDLVTLAKMYDFETIVIDPRGIFSNKTQFSTPPDKIYEKYPAEVLPDYELDPYTYAVVLSHDPKIDDNALHILLRSEVGYIGALGSKRTHAKRVDRLTKAGFSEEEIGRIHAPIGVDIHAKTPREIALSIMGEIIWEKNYY